MTDQELAAVVKNAKGDIDATTITLQSWLDRIQKGYKGKPYAYKSTGWYTGLNSLYQDKTVGDRQLDAAYEHLLETEPPPDPDPSPTPTGALKPGVSFGGIGYPDSATRGRMMDDVKAMGGKSLRMQWWAQDICNQAIDQAISKGLQVFSTVMIEYATTKITEQRAFDEGKQFTDMWGGKVQHVSFWNEPDLAGWDPEPWADCCIGFANGVRASANSANVFIWLGDIWTWKMNSGSTTEGNYAWMVRAYARWKQRGLTGMPGNGFSPHAYGDFSWNDPRNALYGIWGQNGDGKAINCIRHLMDQNGDQAKPIAATESGNNIANAQPAAVNAMFDQRAKGQQQGPLIYCQWDDAAGPFGMRPAEGQTPRAAYSTFTSRAGGISAATPQLSLTSRLMSAVRQAKAPQTPYQIRGEARDHH